MIDDLKKDENLMQYTKILVISQNEEDENQVKDLLKQFKEIKFDKLTNVLENLEDLRKFDVIFFNDINGYIQQENMTKIIDSNINDKAVYFYFNKGKKQLQYEGNENINFAKSNATLCGNLLDLMRYQEDILKNKN